MSTHHRIAALESWASTPDRGARTQPGRDGLTARFEREVDPDGVMSPEDRAKAVDAKRRAHFLRLAQKSAEARRKRVA
jgi:hypothetical protein